MMITSNLLPFSPPPPSLALPVFATIAPHATRNMRLWRLLIYAKAYQGQASTVFFHLARRVPSEMKITKMGGTVVLGRPGGMCGGAGEDFEGVRDLQI